MKKEFDNELYLSGLVASGCWDELDEYAKKAIEKFGELVAVQCASIALANDNPYTALDIYTHFGIKDD